MDFYTLPATEVARGIREGCFSCVELLQSCLVRIEQTDAAIRAWVFLDPDLAPGPGPIYSLRGVRWARHLGADR